MNRRRIPSLLLVPLLIVLLAACSGAVETTPTATPEPSPTPAVPTPVVLTPTPQPTPAPTATPPPTPTAIPLPDPVDLLARVSEANSDLDSITSVSDIAVTDPSGRRLAVLHLEHTASVTGEATRETRLFVNGPYMWASLEQERYTGGLTYSLDVRGNVERMDELQPSDGQWVWAGFSESNGRTSVSTGIELGFAAEDSDDVEVVLEELDGIPAFRLSGLMPDEDAEIAWALWVGVDDLLIRRLELEGPGVAESLMGNLRGLDFDLNGVAEALTISFSRHNAPVSVEPPDLSEAQALLVRAVQAVSGAAGFRVSGPLDWHEQIDDPESQGTLHTDLQYAAPDRMSQVLTVENGGTTERTEVRSIGDFRYTRSGEDSHWVPRAADGGWLRRPHIMLGLTPQLSDLDVVGRYDWDGRDVVILRGWLYGETLGAGGGEIGVELWLAEDTLLPVRVRTAGLVTRPPVGPFQFFGGVSLIVPEQAASLSMVQTLAISGYEDVIEIEAPAAFR